MHIEHGSDFVKLNSWLKSFIALVYDKTIWKWIFKKADVLVAISEAVKTFIQQKFINRPVEVIYRGVELNYCRDSHLNKKLSKGIKIWFIWRLVKLKWVDQLIEIFDRLIKDWIRNVSLNIVWDWDERPYLEKEVKERWLTEYVKFWGMVSKEIIVTKLLPDLDIVVNPSCQEWLPSSLIDALLFDVVVVASDAWWTPEISDKADLLIHKVNDLDDFYDKLKIAIENCNELKGKSVMSIKRRFDWNKNIMKYKELINKIS